jgi:hypothetical protein
MASSCLVSNSAAIKGTLYTSHQRCLCNIRYAPGSSPLWRQVITFSYPGKQTVCRFPGSHIPMWDHTCGTWRRYLSKVMVFCYSNVYYFKDGGVFL